MLLTGALESTNEWYAVAKIAGIKLCQAYRHQYGSDFMSVMPTNLYGPHDNFDLASSHVLPALIAKAQAAKVAGQTELVIWGTGSPRREFLHVDDLADACIILTQHYSGAEHVNIGTGSDITISELARIVTSAVGWEGRFVYDAMKPDGTPRKLLNVTKLTELGWTVRIGLTEGIEATYKWYVESRAQS